MPALPAELDRDPEPLGVLVDGSMGTLAVTNVTDAQRYGQLGVRYNTLRTFYGCVRDQINDHKSPAECVK